MYLHLFLYVRRDFFFNVSIAVHVNLRIFLFIQHWDERAARHAQEWADNCNGPAHGNHPNEGQNYAAAYPSRIIFRR